MAGSSSHQALFPRGWVPAVLGLASCGWRAFAVPGTGDWHKVFLEGWGIGLQSLLVVV